MKRTNDRVGRRFPRFSINAISLDPQLILLLISRWKFVKCEISILTVLLWHNTTKQYLGEVLEVVAVPEGFAQRYGGEMAHVACVLV